MRRQPRLTLLPIISAILLASLPEGALAQEGRVDFTHTVKNDSELFEEFEALGGEIWGEIPTHKSLERLLLFSASNSVMVPAPKTDEELSSAMGGLGMEDMSPEELEMMLSKLEAGLGALASMTAELAELGEEELKEIAWDPGSLLQSYVDLDDGSVTDSRTLMGRTFRIEYERPDYEWRLADEQRELLGYVVHKATTVHEGSPVEAWFAPQIPVQAGPGTFGGLPGLILMVSIDDGDKVYLATGVDLTELDEGELRPPEDGDRISRDEWERLVAEKIKETADMASQAFRRPF